MLRFAALRCRVFELLNVLLILPVRPEGKLVELTKNCTASLLVVPSRYCYTFSASCHFFGSLSTSVCGKEMLQMSSLAEDGFHLQHGEVLPDAALGATSEGREETILQRCRKHKFRNMSHFEITHTHIIIYIYIYIIEGSLEVKLPTIWTDEKQSRAEAERRETSEERRVEEKE